MSFTADVTIIGGGIASIGAVARLVEIAPELRIILLEGKNRLAYHSTGRSAIRFIRNYGPPAIRVLNILSEDVFRNPQGHRDDVFSDQPFINSVI